VFKRRRVAATSAADPGVSSVAVFVDELAAAHHEAARAEAWRTLRRIVAEALILQDEAEALLLELRDRRDLAQIAPPCGRLMFRFAALADALPSCGDPAMDRHTAVLRAVLDHHVLMLNTSRALLAAEWRSDRLTQQIDRIDGLGPPARTLERVRAEILERAEVA
jgi:hypothetical protein